ncbi:MAG: S9 family peptidase [Gemmatimonadaceae bacterium]
MTSVRIRFPLCVALGITAISSPARAQGPRPFAPSDLRLIRSVSDVQLAPDGAHAVLTVTNSEAPGRPRSEVRLLTVRTGASQRLGREGEGVSGARWSPKGDRLAYFGREGERYGLIVANADGSNARFVADVAGTNHPLPTSAERLTWSPDGTQLAFVSATAGPEVDANGDPMVITRYLYKPTAGEGLTRFNDNRRLHVFVANVATGAVRQLTTGDYYEHSLDWSPRGDEVLFVSNREPDPDRFFNYDVFAVRVADGTVRRLTSTKNAEYAPVWSPDGSTIAYQGTKRTLTSSETTMEDTHLWTMNANGSDRREVATLDNRQGAPAWSADGRTLYFSLQDHGNVHLYRQTLGQPTAERVIGGTGTLGSWSVGKDGSIAYAFTPAERPTELYLRTPTGDTRRLTTFNDSLIAQRRVAGVDSFTVTSARGRPVQSFLVRPLELTSGKAPLIALIHGGPHGQQGAAFNASAQVYAAHGYGVLLVNYRGSTGYGQAHADAIFGDQDGAEAEDVLVAIDSALARYPWIDATRLGVEGGSYGGQLTNWLVTRTDRFKAAIPRAGISNLVTQNYLSYYHDYLAVEFGSFPHEGAVMDTLWARSPIRYVARVHTPVLFLHGENDNDVPIAEAEQFYIALMDVGVQTQMVRYPREGHGLRETNHVIDALMRSMSWYDRWFAKPKA